MDQLEFSNKILPENPNELKGVIKPKKQLSELVQTIVRLFTDFYSLYMERNQLEPIHDIKRDIEKIKANDKYHPAMVCLLSILRLVNDENAPEMAAMFRGLYETYCETGCKPYTAVVNILAMFKLVFDDKGNVTIELKSEEEIILEMPSEEDTTSDTSTTIQ